MNKNIKIMENQPPKGTSDWFPAEFKIRQYIFETFREVCNSFGYEEYLTPTFEKADIYRAKSGEDVGGKELMNFTDKGGREYALRPEMTPSVTRMVSRIYEQEAKPLRYFSIANFFRNEKPQRGRNREFWQLNYDIFGTESLYADAEIIKMGISIMLKFIPTDRRSEKPFVTYINDRKIITNFLENLLDMGQDAVQIVRILDKKEKVPKDVFCTMLEECNLNSQQIEKILEFTNPELTITDLENYVDKESSRGITEVLKILKDEGYAEWIKFKPNLIRGFDYYTGIVYEIFDNNPENRRALFGGGRYDGLGELFGKKNISAVGCAPGDEGIKLFLESWNLLTNISKQRNSYYLPIIEEGTQTTLNKIAQNLRKDFRVIQGLERESLSKALEFANKKCLDKVVILGFEELKKGHYIEKNMEDGEQTVRIL